MPCRGVFFAISEATCKTLEDAESDDDVMNVVESLEDDWVQENLCEVDKAWDAMHRAHSDGTLDYDAGEYPLNHAVLGGKQLLEGDHHIVTLVTPKEVGDVAMALVGVDEHAFRGRYADTVPHDYAPEYGDEDRDYTWAYLDELRRFYGRAAAAGRAVIFTVDQ